MKSRQSGFTMIELIIVMAIFTLVIMSASDMFVSLLSDYKQQSKIAITNIEGILGLEMLRRDIEHAGYGLPWDNNGMGYSEIPVSNGASALNDAPSAAPRAIVIGSGAGLHGSDRLAIKASNVAMSNTCEKWTLLDKTNNYAPWPSAMDDLSGTDNVILISQGPTSRTLIPAAGGFSTTFVNRSNFDLNRSETSIVYGIDPNTAPKMPFNRADYYVATAAVMPTHCAAGTGQLFKAVASHIANTAFNDPPMAVLDCVADMQVVLVSDNNEDGSATDVSEASIATAEDVRKVREVRVYILAQEGQRDKNFTHSGNPVRVGETGGLTGTVGRDFDFAANGITDWQHYRWKLYTMVVRPVNLR